MGSTLPVIYGNGNQIFQTPGVGASSATRWCTRRACAARRPAGAPNIQWYRQPARPLGRQHAGRRDDELLDKTGIGGNGNGAPTSEMLKLVERFTRVAAGDIQVQAAVDDPTSLHQAVDDRQ